MENTGNREAASLVACAVRLVLSQVEQHRMEIGELCDALRTIHAQLMNVSTHDVPPARAADSAAFLMCRECGKKMQLINNTHLRLHGLTVREYKRKWGVGLSQSLSSPALRRRRQRLAKQQGMGQGLAHWRAARSNARNGQSGQ